MFKYVSDVSILSHNIIKEYIPEKDVAIDATLGNGYDCHPDGHDQCAVHADAGADHIHHRADPR